MAVSRYTQQSPSSSDLWSFERRRGYLTFYSWAQLQFPSVLNQVCWTVDTSILQSMSSCVCPSAGGGEDHVCQSAAAVTSDKWNLAVSVSVCVCVCPYLYILYIYFTLNHAGQPAFDHNRFVFYFEVRHWSAEVDIYFLLLSLIKCLCSKNVWFLQFY